MTLENKCPIKWLNCIFKELSNALTLEEALHSVMERTKDFIHVQTLAVIVINENTDDLSIKTSRNLSYSFVKQYRRTFAGTLIPQVILRHQTLCMNNIPNTDIDYQILKLENDYTSIFLTPILYKQRAVGYLHADREDGVFQEQEVQELQLIGFIIELLMEKYELLLLTRHLERVDEPSKALKYHAFLDEYRRELTRAKSDGRPLGLAMVDLDGYTQFVQTCGIPAGHALLERTARLIMQSVREIDIVGRFSSDEFIICLGGISHAETEATLERIRKNIEQGAAGASGGVVTACGAALSLEKPGDYDIPLEKVLTALGCGLMTAQAKGTNTVIMIDPPRE